MAAVGIFDRVAGLPMVQSTCGKITEVYGSAKDSIAIVNVALNAVEASVQAGVQVVSTSAQPIVQTLEKPIAKADEFACRQFDYLQESVPAIQSTPEEALEGTKRYFSDKLRTGTDAVTNNPVTRLVSSRVDRVLTVTEGVVDYVLPGESAPNGTGDLPSYNRAIRPTEDHLSRISSISSKVTDRTYALTMKQVNNAQHRAEEALVKMRSNLALVVQAQEELKFQRERLLNMVDGPTIMATVQDQVTAVRAGISSAQTSVMSSIPANVSLPAFKVDAVIENLSRLTASTQASFQTLSALARHLPDHLHRPIDIALEHSRSLHSMVLEAARGSPITSSMLDQANSLISTISASTTAVGEYVRKRLESIRSMAQKSGTELGLRTEKTSTEVFDDEEFEEEEDEEDGVTEV